MDSEQRIESLLCEGDAVVVEDPVNGRTVRGSEALYTPGDRQVLITGAPVVLEQRDGTEMEGRRLRYDLDTGEVRILSEPRIHMSSTRRMRGMMISCNSTMRLMDTAAFERQSWKASLSNRKSASVSWSR